VDAAATPGPDEAEAWATLRRERENLIAAGDYAAVAGDAEATGSARTMLSALVLRRRCR
jgi:hypothetical protein